jgi:hypothetical protein
MKRSDLAIRTVGARNQGFSAQRRENEHLSTCAVGIGASSTGSTALFPTLGAATL